MSEENVVLKFWKEREDAVIPEIAYGNSSGAFDIRSCEEVVIPAHSRKTVPNGLRIMIPRGYYAVFHEKSGLYFKQNIKVFNGLVDFGYTGEQSCTNLYKNAGNFLLIKSEIFTSQIIRSFCKRKLQCQCRLFRQF